jgi:hypothetical protein
MTVVMGFWLLTHPTSVRGAPILGISFIVIFGFLLFLVLEAVRAYLKEKKHVAMNPLTKKELVILGSSSLLATASWLWLIQPHNWHDALLVLLAGMSGIAGTLFMVGLIGRTDKEKENDEQATNK